MKVLNIGSCNIDYVYQVDHFVQPGETMDCLSMQAGCGGKGLNQSIAIAQAGAEVFHAGFIGPEGEFLRKKLEDKGVDTSLLRTSTGANGHAIIQVDRQGMNCILLYGGSNQQLTEEYVDSVLAQFSPGDILVLQNEINMIPYIMEKAYAAGLRIAFNAAPYQEAVRNYPLDKVTWLIVNEVEGGGLSGRNEPDDIARELRRLYPKTNLLLTLGKAGCIYLSDEGTFFQKACRVEAVDTTAAGDTFTGYFIKGICDGLNATQTLRLATAASAIAVTRPGAADSVPTFEEVAHSELLKTL